MQAFKWVSALLLTTAVSANAQTELSFYGGTLLSADGTIGGNDPAGIGAFGFSSDWEESGDGAERMFGARIVWWQSNDSGWGLDFEHAPMRADPDALVLNGLDAFEFGGGTSLVTLNAYHRWSDQGLLVPYVGAGIGFSIPMLEFDSVGGTTARHKLAGPAMQWVAGASVPLRDNWAVFGEYKGSYVANSTELSGGGTVRADVFSNAFNVGVTLGF